MLNELLILSDKQELPTCVDTTTTYSAENTYVRFFSDLEALLSHLVVSVYYTLEKDSHGIVQRVKTNDLETELNHSISICVDSTFNYSLLSNDQIVLFLKFRFKHLNPVIVNQLNSVLVPQQLAKIENHVSTRLRRVQTWCIYDSKLDPVLDSMFNRYNNDFPSDEEIAVFTSMTSKIVDFDLLVLNLSKPNDQYYLDAINRWDFNAFEFNIDDLLYIGFIILRDYFKESKESINKLKSFLFFTRDNYRIGNPFHNFRHAIDVLQATHYFLKVLNEFSEFKISKIESFTLLLSSLGHDLGHPGITNAFLSNYSSPLSKEFPSSLLENYHLLKFKKILIPFLKQCINDDLLVVKNLDLRNFNELLHSAIIATDMAKHDEFVKKISILETDFNNFQLLACILIKCADISNVCRLLNTSCKWGLSLGEEFKQISQLENYRNSPAKNISLLDDSHIKNHFKKLIKNIDVDEGIKLVDNLSNNQMFFINVFAREFFTKVSNSIPQLNFLKHHLLENATFWETVIIEKNKS